jgi:hypothetical protein
MCGRGSLVTISLVFTLIPPQVVFIIFIGNYSLVRIFRYMEKNVNPGNHSKKSLVECNIPSPILENFNDDLPPLNCPPPIEPNLRNPGGEALSWLTDVCHDNVGLGAEALCDPMQTGQIVNDLENRVTGPYNQSTIYRYSKSVRGCDEAVTDLFRNLVVLDVDGKAFPVPIIWGSQERAVAVILQNQVRKDDSLVIDRPVLPMLSIRQTNIAFKQDRYAYHQALNYLARRYEGEGLEYEGLKPGFTIQERIHPRDTVFGVARGIPVDISYTLIAWTMYIEEMNQILEQILLKFSPIAYIRIRGVSWEVGVKLDSIANNLEAEPGEKQRVVKFEFTMTAESFVPQPITRKKAVLKERINIFNSVDEQDLNDVIERLEITIKELST